MSSQIKIKHLVCLIICAAICAIGFFLWRGNKNNQATTGKTIEPSVHYAVEDKTNKPSVGTKGRQTFLNDEPNDGNSSASIFSMNEYKTRGREGIMIDDNYSFAEFTENEIISFLQHREIKDLDSSFFSKKTLTIKESTIESFSGVFSGILKKNSYSQGVSYIYEAADKVVISLEGHLKNNQFFGEQRMFIFDSFGKEIGVKNSKGLIEDIRATEDDTINIIFPDGSTGGQEDYFHLFLSSDKNTIIGNYYTSDPETKERKPVSYLKLKRE